MGHCLEVLFTVVKTTSNSSSLPFLKSQSRGKLQAATAILLVAALCSPAILLYYFPHIASLPITVRYPRCNHIVLVSARRHGSTWFISNAENCLSVNGSYGDLIRTTEIWHHGRVKEITLENAIDLAWRQTSVKIFPNALYNHRKRVRKFLEAMRNLQVPVFVLTRNLENSFASLQDAKKTNLWNLDNGGAVVHRESRAGKEFFAYKNRMQAYFEDMKTLMNDVGVAWDEVQYETILSQRVILGRRVRCYVRNCNFN